MFLTTFFSQRLPHKVFHLTFSLHIRPHNVVITTSLYTRNLSLCALSPEIVIFKKYAKITILEIFQKLSPSEQLQYMWTRTRLSRDSSGPYKLPPIITLSPKISIFRKTAKFLFFSYISKITPKGTPPIYALSMCHRKTKSIQEKPSSGPYNPPAIITLSIFRKIAKFQFYRYFENNPKRHISNEWHVLYSFHGG